MKTLIVLGIIGFLVLIGFGLTFGSFYNDRTVECTVTEKDRGYDHDSGGSKYRVYTEECGTLSNEDDLFRGKWDSGDIQGQLKVGETYTLHVVGPRSGFLSTFPNILEVNDLQP